VTESTGCGHHMLTNLLAASHLMAMEQLPAKTAECAPSAGFTQVLIYLVDLQQRVLRLLTASWPDADPAADGEETEVPIEGTVAGRAYQYGQVLPGAAASHDGADVHQLWVPLLDGTERMGVLRVTSTVGDEETRRNGELLASLLALILASKRESSDSYPRLTRTAPMSVGAEMQWQLMPERTYADGQVVISASLEPAYDTSGDVFDYSIDGPLVHLSIFDAMGHDTAASLTASLALGASRNARRSGAGLVETSEIIEAALIEQFARNRYVTGILADLDTRNGVLRWVNRGHHPPLIIRGGRWSTHLSCRPAHPMGTDLGLKTVVCQEQLEPGDRIVLYTDGITEARSRNNVQFGRDQFVDFLVRHNAAGLPVPETLRRLVRAVLDHHDGQMQDDATVLFCEWLGRGATARAAALAGLPEPERAHHRHDPTGH